MTTSVTVYWLVLWLSSSMVVIPQPYLTLEACKEAVGLAERPLATRYLCVPQLSPGTDEQIHRWLDTQPQDDRT